MALLITVSCTKKGGDTSSLYTPAAADVTATATLQELQQGRALYIDNCNACHQLFSPDTYSPSQWRNILSNMSARAGLSSSQAQLVTKYVTRGN
jgi:mono/diheme cytochrome c family protein